MRREGTTVTISIRLLAGAPLRAIVTHRPHWLRWFLFAADERVYTAMPDGRGGWVEVQEGEPCRPVSWTVQRAIERAMRGMGPMAVCR